ncbi:hypothetical protein JCM18899A_39170 [Nocardioides sp. AN3]
MTLGFDFHPEACAEFVAAVDWYDQREVGLARLPLSGRPFRAENDAAAAR